MSSSTTSNGNSEKSAKKLDLVVPDGVAPIARTEEMSDDLSEETLVNGESSISEHSKSQNKQTFYFVFHTLSMYLPCKKNKASPVLIATNQNKERHKMVQSPPVNNKMMIFKQF